MSEHIQCFMAAGEGEREKGIRRALAGDGRFALIEIRSDLPVDLQFIGGKQKYEILGEPICDYKVFNVELKICQDFVSSVLSGHLYNQVLSCREYGSPACVVILGDIGSIYAAIEESSEKRFVELPNGKKKIKMLNDDEKKQANATTLARCKSFRKRSMLNGIPVFHRGDDSGFFDREDQFKDILELAHDYLTDGSMMGFRQRPADHEREATALCMAKGIGEKTAKAILADYGSISNLCTASLEDLCEFKQDGRRIGQRKAEAIIKLLHSEIPNRNDPHIKVRA